LEARTIQFSIPCVEERRGRWLAILSYDLKRQRTKEVTLMTL
jgi:hypothetical protein